jgi:ribonuclease Z
MSTRTILFTILCLHVTLATPSLAQDDCLRVTLVGTQGGPAQREGLGLPGPTTLVEFGSTDSDCRDGAQLLFDVGRAAVVELSKLDVRTSDIDAIFVTHIHSDHTDGLYTFFNDLWYRSGSVDVVCHDRVEFANGQFVDCEKLVVGVGADKGAFDGIDGPLEESGEIALRQFDGSRSSNIQDSPSDRANMVLLNANNTARVIWSKDDVAVSVVRSTHVAGHASYRVETPIGNAVIGGDAANDNLDPFTRPWSTSDQVEALAAGAQILVHSAIHPALAPGSGFPIELFRRQSTALDLGAMAERAGVQHLMLTHLFPAIGQDNVLGFPITPLTSADWAFLALIGGFTGQIHVGPPGTSVQIGGSP